MEHILTIAVAILLLILFAALFGGAFYAIIWVLGKFILWIIKKPIVAKRLSEMQKRIQDWWKQNEQRVEGLWEFVSEILVEPLLFAFVVVVLFNRIQQFLDFANAHKDASFWQLLVADMNTSTLYIWFILVFTIWMFYRAYKHSKERQERKELIKKLDAIKKAIEGKTNSEVNNAHNNRDKPTNTL